jgi:GNAT superfamily N-acetyltransferase
MVVGVTNTHGLVSLRRVTPDDAGTVLRFIRELAEYEREPDAVEATVESLRADLAAPRPPFECLLAEVGGEPVGFALFFQNYSTWRGRPGIYLEDLYVTPARRGQGAGKALFLEVARIAVERGAGRYEWAVLDWNQPAIDFYLSLGAVAMSEWTVFRLGGDALERLVSDSR